MRVLGLDPSTTATGYAVLDPGPAYVEAGVLTTRKKDPRNQRIVGLGDDIQALIAEFRPGVIAVETAKWGGYASACGALGEIRGVIVWLAYVNKLPVEDWAPSKARAAVGVGGGANKEAVARHVTRVLRLRNQPAPDAADALAVALAQLTRTMAATR